LLKIITLYTIKDKSETTISLRNNPLYTEDMKRAK